MNKRIKKTLIIIAIIVTISAFFYWQNNCLDITYYELEYNNLPQGFSGYKIVLISDMHGKTFGRKNNILSKKIKALKPDILLVSGDMLSSTIDDGQAFLDFLDEFENSCPVYMCLGNHEQIARWFSRNGDKKVDYERFITGVKNRGVIVLDNRKVKISSNGHTVWLNGLTLELYHYSRKDIEYQDDNLLLTKSYIDEVIGKPEKGFNILLTHNPVYFNQYAEWGADLVLAGHIHGGIIQVPFMGGLLSPDRVFFPEYDEGLFEEGDAKMIVNRGLGNSVINFRLFNRPEISSITLYRSN
jgi:predicted MPP superfamily phosphohydrolase